MSFMSRDVCASTNLSGCVHKARISNLGMYRQKYACILHMNIYIYIYICMYIYIEIHALYDNYMSIYVCILVHNT